MSKRRKQWTRKPTRTNLPEMKVDRKRVAIVIPAEDMCHTGFTLCLAHMIKDTLLQLPENLEALTVNSYGTSMLPFSRQILAKTALEQGVTHMLWIDSDMEFPSDMLLSFLLHDAPIIGINAMSRRKPYKNTAQSAPATPLVTTPDSTGLEKVYRCGFGVMWTAAEVFERMELPWFDSPFMPEYSVPMGEDYYFCEKAKKLGYEIYIDHDISKRVYHIGTFGYNPQMMTIAGEILEQRQDLPNEMVDMENEGERAA
jgi:hypothetical protein